MPTKLAYEKSFASHPKSQFWSSMNEGLPEDYALNSHKKFIFDCDKCNHNFKQDLNHINTWNRWCPYCTNQKLCNNIDCNDCFNKSFASHPKSQFWSNKNIVSSRDVYKNSNIQYLFNCFICKHHFKISPNKINQMDRWCYFCSGRKLCENELCNMCHNTSFASIDNSKYLIDNEVKPRMLFKNSNKSYNFKCNLCSNVFTTKLSIITGGSWCRCRTNKGEQKFYDNLILIYPKLKRQFKANWCKNLKTNNYLPFDFVLEDKKIIFEMDGFQHFKQVGKWQSPELTNINDNYKMECANKNGYSIIRILQDDVFKDKYNWLEELQLNIKKIEDDNIVQNIYMCKNNEYKDFDKLFKEDLDQSQEVV
jgi:very-short-patch-repair endonuclease